MFQERKDTPLLDHISFGVADLVRSAAFYDAVLAPLGFARVWSALDAVGYGYSDQDDSFAIKQDVAGTVASRARSHLAFAAASREAVIGFYTAAIAHGAVDEGAPDLCPEYGATYFAAFVRDPDGHRLEAVCHG